MTRVHRAVDHVLRAVWDAEPIALANWGSDFSIKSTAYDGDVVTPADVGVERSIRSYLKNGRLSEFGVFGEEEGHTGPTDNFVAIDPIDSTRNYTQRRYGSSTEVSIVVAGETVGAVSHLFNHGLTLFAVKGYGAYVSRGRGTWNKAEIGPRSPWGSIPVSLEVRGATRSDPPFPFVQTKSSLSPTELVHRSKLIRQQCQRGISVSINGVPRKFEADRHDAFSNGVRTANLVLGEELRHGQDANQIIEGWLGDGTIPSREYLENDASQRVDRAARVNAGSSEHMSLADVVVFLDAFNSPWDTESGKLIAEEAGATVGHMIELDDGSLTVMPGRGPLGPVDYVAAATPELFEGTVQAIQESSVQFVNERHLVPHLYGNGSSGVEIL